MSMALAAQELIEKMKESKTHLEDLCIATHDQLTKEDKIQLRIIRRKLDNSETLKPLGFFSLNKNSLLSIFGTGITYCIILMQFKQVKF